MKLKLKNIFRNHVQLVSRVACLAIIGLGQMPAAADTLLQYDFNDTVTWPLTATKPGQAGVIAGKFGTVDTANSKDASGGLLLIMDRGASTGWVSRVQSGALAVQTTETNLGKLTLSFSLKASRALPIKVLVESFNEKQERTGGLETRIYPAAADFYQRYALDLSTMKAAGEGVFNPTAPFVGFTIATGTAEGWPAATHHELRLDNVHYATAAYYVSPQGSDANDGRTEQTAFASPQKAMDAAQPGDIILLMNGSYTRAEGKPERTPVANFLRPGTPAGWITLKNYPGHQPVLSAHGQQAVSIVQVKGQPTLAYLEVRGLHVRGNGDTASEKYPDELGKFTPNTDIQGIVVNGRVTPHPGARTENEIVHNIRLADNLVEFCTADGIYVEYCDWLFVERNTIQNNCWTTPGYAPAGFAVMGYANFDAQDNIYKMLVAGNRVSGNKLTVMNQPWGQPKKTSFYNGNGMLFDANAEKPPAVYLGRTLVQNNLVFNNGGGGIQIWGNHRMDLVNNTVHLNGTVVPWGQFGFERCQDVRLVNNIIVAQPNGPLDTWFLNRMDQGTDRILRVQNLYWGGAAPCIEGINDLKSDPLFVRPSADPTTANFHLQTASPALNAGRWEPFSPIIDLDGRLRPLNGPPSLGAFEN
jgi:hypothetical protein